MSEATATKRSWDGRPVDPSALGSLHFLRDQDGDLEVARWGFHPSVGEFWQLLGQEEQPCPQDMSADGFRYVGPILEPAE